MKTLAKLANFDDLSGAKKQVWLINIAKLAEKYENLYLLAYLLPNSHVLSNLLFFGANAESLI